MSPSTEDAKTPGVVHHDNQEETQKLGLPVEDVVIHRITEEDLMIESGKALDLKSGTGLRLLGIVIVMGINQAAYGIDWGVIGNLNSFKSWHEHYGFANTGVIIGTINGLMTVGSFVGAPCLTFQDTIGRRGINFAGNLLVIVAAFMQGFAPNLSCFMAGRFVLGFGTALCSGPQYMAEIAPIHLRGRLVGVFGACYQVGAIAMIAAMMGFANWTTGGNWQWRVPLLLEAVGPVIFCATIYLCPETPRYLTLKNRREEARKVIARYMTTANDVDAPFVRMVEQQIEESLEASRTGVKASWDFRIFFTKSARYRTMLLALYACFQQWNGGGIIGQYLSPALDTIGITSTFDQVSMNLGLTATYFVFTCLGAYLIDVFSRRFLIFSGLISFIIIQTAVTLTSWQYSVTKSHATASLTLFWYFMNQVFSASLIATMHNLYPVEILSLPLRAKGMGLFNMFQGAAGVVQSYGISVGIGDIGYKIWVVYIVYNAIQLVASYFLFPETSRLSLEEIDNIFETPGTNPVKLSLKIKKAKREREALDREELVSSV